MKPLLALALSIPALTCCDSTATQPQAVTSTTPSYTPGLGEFTSAIQVRHARLWFAGNAKNWQLAGDELDELKEVFDEVVKYQPVFKGKSVAKIIELMTARPIAESKRRLKPKTSLVLSEPMTASLMLSQRASRPPITASFRSSAPLLPH